MIDQGREEIDNPYGTKYNLHDVQPEEWVKAFEEEIKSRKDNLENLQNTEHPTTEQLDKYANLLTSTIQTAMEKQSKTKRKSTHLKPW